MNTTRCAKWGKEARFFFENAEDKSVDLDVIISYGCHSQSGEGFEELVNLLNSEPTKRKIRKLSILDTSYLYRHGIPEFEKYSDPNVPTEWFLTNKDAIEHIETPVNLRSWAKEIDCEKFLVWKEKVYIEFEGDKNGNGINLQFRDLVVSEAAVASYKTGKTIESCIDFMLEECAHTCMIFGDNTNLVYPMKVSRPVAYLAERNNIKINHLKYRASVQNHDVISPISVELEDVDREVALFMQNKVTNVNFFVMDKNGNHIYKNYAYAAIVGDVNFIKLDPESWKVSQEVMRTRKQVIIEEEYQGMTYLSMKAPLIINNNVEGVIGLAVDITEKKKNEDLALENRLQAIKINEQNRISEIAEYVAHDIRSPLATISAVTATLRDIPENRRVALRTAVASINNITNDLLNKYKNSREEENMPFSVRMVLTEVIDQKKYQYKETSVKFENNFHDSFLFVKGNRSDFARMISNIINNAVEAFRNKSGIVTIETYKVGNFAGITVQDTGSGISEHMLSEIRNNISVGSTKKEGYGIGLTQVKKTIKKFRGTISIDSELNKGTKVKLTIPLTKEPSHVLFKIKLREDDIVVVLDDEPSILAMWKERFSVFPKIRVEYFNDENAVRKFVQSVNKKYIVFLSDLELRNKEINGIDVIKELGLTERAILVTNSYSDKKTKEMAETLGIKILPKPMVSDIKIEKTDIAKQKIVVIDDNEGLANSLVLFLEGIGDISVDTYSSPEQFIKKESLYDIETKFIIDNNCNSKMTGIALAERLASKGFTKLYLLSGTEFKASEVPSYLTVLLKGNIDELEKVILTH